MPSKTANNTTFIGRERVDFYNCQVKDLGCRFARRKNTVPWYVDFLSVIFTVKCAKTRRTCAGLVAGRSSCPAGIDQKTLSKTASSAANISPDVPGAGIGLGF